MRCPEAMRVLRRPAAWLMALGCCAASANDAPLPPEPTTGDAVVESPRSRPVAASSSWAARAASELRPAPGPLSTSVRIVELPADGLPGAAGQRRHHALSINSEMPQRMLRSLGVDATDCSTRFRMPSKLRQEAGGSISVNVQAQVGLACRF